MTQTRLQSLAESGTNALIGYTVAVFSNAIILPLCGVPVTVAQSAEIGVWFVAVSLVRSYAIRRWFDR